MSSSMQKPRPRDTVKEGVAEVKDKLKQDLSRWTRTRRAVSLKSMMGCLECDAAGKVACSACGGEGKQKIVWNDEIQDCPTCVGTGRVTCVECAGKGVVPNKNRKRLLWVLGLGAVGWLLVLLMLMGFNPFPEQRAKYLSGGGGGKSMQTSPKPAGTNTPPGGRMGPTGTTAPGTGGTGTPAPGPGTGVGR